MMGIALSYQLLMGAVLDPATAALIAAMTAKPDAERERLIDSTIGTLRTAGVWDKLDMLQVYAAHDQQAARVDWKDPSRVAIAVNSPGFTADMGFSGDGATSYVDTGWTTGGNTNFTLNNHTFGVKVVGNPQTASVFYAGTERIAINLRNLSSLMTARSLNTTSQIGGAPTLTARYGYIVRSSNVGYTGYQATGSTGFISAIINPTQGTNGVNSVGNVWVGGINNTGTLALPATQTISMVFAGAALDLTELQAFTNAMVTYMNAVGAP